ncbi:hypothetical protein RJ639_026569, partial [Escallonia herrerae]
MDSGGAYNNRGDRIWGFVTGMEYVAARVDSRRKECVGMWTGSPDKLIRDWNCLYHYVCNQYEIPDFHNIEWLSVVAAIMSFTYSFIGLGLGAAKTIGNGVIKGNIEGVSTSSAIQKGWLVSQALGDIAFAYPYAIILIEIQDTLKSPPPENETMKKASIVALCTTTFFYLCCGGFGYAAFGDQTPGNLLTGFGFYEPYWLIDFANACIVLHLVGGYQVVLLSHNLAKPFMFCST